MSPANTNRYIRALLPLALGPLTQHGVGFELHAQNSVIRICKRTKRVKGFAIRDLAGVKLHGPTLKDQGFDITNLGATVTEDIHQVWNRVHHALVQNHIGYLLYSLGLEGDSCDGWQIVHSELERVLSGPGSTAQAIFQYFVKETMPLKSFIRMRMGASFKSVNCLHFHLHTLCLMVLILWNSPFVLSKLKPRMCFGTRVPGCVRSR